MLIFVSKIVILQSTQWLFQTEIQCHFVIITITPGHKGVFIFFLNRSKNSSETCVCLSSGLNVSTPTSMKFMIQKSELEFQWEIHFIKLNDGHHQQWSHLHHHHHHHHHHHCRHQSLITIYHNISFTWLY